MEKSIESIELASYSRMELIKYIRELEKEKEQLKRYVHMIDPVGLITNEFKK